MFRRFFVTFVAAALALPAGAAAMTFSYYREHKVWCDANLPTDQFAREQCVNRDWCDAHWNDDRVTRITCDPFRSRADFSQPSVKVSIASLDAGRDLSDAEIGSTICLDEIHDFYCSDPVLLKDVLKRPAIRLLPPGMKTARLALAAVILLGQFPATVVKIGIGAAGQGVMSLTWNLNGKGPRRTETIRLGGYEVDHLLAALNRSSFWQMPHNPRHQGVADGEIATVEVSVPERRNHVTDVIGPDDAVDLSVLVNEIGMIIGHHWKDVPGGDDGHT
jgi:hypothetical protein